MDCTVGAAAITVAAAPFGDVTDMTRYFALVLDAYFLWRLTCQPKRRRCAASRSTRESADDRFPFREVSEVLCYDGLDRTRVDVQVTVYHKVAESHHFQCLWQERAR